MQNQLIYVPVARLNPITHGVRKTNGVPIDDLAASIKAEGLLQNLTIVRDAESPFDGAIELQSFRVVAGCRRLRALKLLVDKHDLPADHTVPCLLIDDEKALSASLAENVIRVQMKPADEFVAFLELVHEGKSVEDISARFGVTPLVVQRRLKLAKVSPKIFEIYRTTTDISLDQMMALAIVDDHKAQEKAWFKSQEWQRTPDRLREQLTLKEISFAKDPIARFVGRKAYEQAGGAVHEDLFQENGGYAVDGKLLQVLAAKQLEECAERVRKEGWSFVKVIPEHASNEVYKYNQADASKSRKPGDVERKLLAELEAEYEQIHARQSKLQEVDDWSTNEEWDRLEAREEEITAAIKDIKDGLRTWDPKVLSKGGAIITIEHGQLKIYRGLVSGRVPASSPDAAESKSKEKQKAKKIAAGEGHTDALFAELTTCVTHAMATECIGNPGVAIIALTHRLLLEAFYHNANSAIQDHPVRITGRNANWRSAEAEIPHPEQSADLAKFSSEEKALRALLPKKSEDLFAWLLTKDAPVPRLLAFCVAGSIDAALASEKSLGRWGAGPLAAALKVDMSTRWTPGIDNYLSRVSAAVLIAAMKEAGADGVTLVHAESLKKADVIKLAQPILAGSAWVPKPMRFGEQKAGAQT